MKTLLAVLVLSIASFGQANFQASTNQAIGGTVFTHTTCGGSGCMLDSRISTSSTTGFTSPAAVNFFHFQGKDFNTSPDNGVILLGRFQFGTGSLISGDLNTTAVFGSDQSYVVIDSNGSCGAFTMSGNCKVGFTAPNTATMFVGIFLGNVTLITNLDGSKTLQGVVRGTVNGGSQTVDLNFTAQTGQLLNGQLAITSASVSPF